MLVRGSSKAATPPEYKSEQGQNNKGARKQEYSFLFFRFWFLFGFLLIPGNVNVYERSTLKLMLHIVGWQTQQPNNKENLDEQCHGPGHTMVVR